MVNCAAHGWQEESLVCQHIAQSLLTGIRVGFHWPESSTKAHPDVWCSACEKARLAAGGDWTPEVVEAQLQIKVLCGSCYERAKSIWSVGYAATQ